MEKTRILVLSPLGGSENGADIAMNHQMRYLSALGYEVFLITRAPNTAEYQAFLTEYQIKHYLLDYTWWTDESLSEGQDAVRNIRAIAEIEKIIADEKIEVAITNTANIPQLAMAAALCNIPHLWLIHEFPEGEFAYTREKYDFISSFSNEILTASDVLADTIQKLSNQKASNATPVNYFNPFTDVSKIQIDKTEQPARLISVNTVNGARKNTLELIKIFEQIKQDFPQLELVITGAIINKDYYQELLEYISEHQIKDVQFLDNYAANWKSVNSSDIFVNSSVMETFSLTIIESLKLGVMTVVSDNYAAKSMRKLDYLVEEDIYEIGNISQAVEKITAKLKNIDQAKQHARLLQERVLAGQSLEKITASLVNAIGAYSHNPRQELRYFEKQFKGNAKELDYRMSTINEERQLLEERLDIISKQNNILEERLEIINEQDSSLKDRSKLLDQKNEELKAHHATIEIQDAEIKSIKQRKWYKLGVKLGLL